MPFGSSNPTSLRYPAKDSFVHKIPNKCQAHCGVSFQKKQTLKTQLIMVRNKLSVLKRILKCITTDHGW